ncbi:MAG: TrkA family potassium uptake protein [Flavobacteriales bacterium]
MNETDNPLNLFSSRILIAVLAIVLLIFGGVLGFMLIEDYNFIDAMFMTVITMSTVGYEEVHPLGDGGKIFASILIICSFSTFAYAISVITTYFVTGQFKTSLERRNMIKTLNNLENHTIVCGYGRVGKKVAKKLKGYNKSFVIIENNEDKAEHISKVDGFICIHGDATKDQNLLDAGIGRASAVITTLPKDADNLYVVLTSRELNNHLTIISRASEKESVRKLKIAGASNVIMPDTLGGAHMASLVVTPDVMEFIDQVSIQGVGDTNLEELNLENLSEFSGNVKLKEITQLEHRKLNVVGCKRESGEIIINPEKELMLQKTDKLFVLGLPENISSFRKDFS